MTVKEDEMRFRAAVLAQYDRPDPPLHVRDIAEQVGLHSKRAEYICQKWTEKGWWDYGVSPTSGWLTDKGRVEMRILLFAYT